ncbi:hypothetical protein DPMN_050719 [Dreissena polymorpha]|uniref:Uncharacterized protein n=1 Tax=Dreissena polymorpha TaxID=45954 RepID=A0A9D4CHA9_DREPO|nr:hypothetical protein DPMN_050719 [Dreissena polymorpha]
MMVVEVVAGGYGGAVMIVVLVMMVVIMIRACRLTIDVKMVQASTLTVVQGPKAPRFWRGPPVLSSWVVLREP